MKRGRTVSGPERALTVATTKLTAASSTLARKVPAQARKVGAKLVVAQKKTTRVLAKNPWRAVVGASVVGYALAKLKR